MTDMELWLLEIERWRKSICDLGEDIRRKRSLIDRHVADAVGEKNIEELAVRVAGYERLIISIQAEIDAWEQSRGGSTLGRTEPKEPEWGADTHGEDSAVEKEDPNCRRRVR